METSKPDTGCPEAPIPVGSKPPCVRNAEIAAKTGVFHIDLIQPILITAFYVYALRFVALETGTARGLPIVFSEVSLLAPFVASVAYFAFIYFGTKAMEKRDAFDLKGYMIIYNLYQVVLNAYAVFAFVRQLSLQKMSIWGNMLDPSQNGFEISLLIWIHYANKYVELLDTVFMVLRKNTRQVSFLHVYHHVLLLWSWWVVCKVACGGDAYFGACVNSLIHVIMYVYYLASLLKIYIPFKSSITSLQMLQFMVCAAHSFYCFYKQHVTLILPGLQLWVMTNMLYLFGRFYMAEYCGKTETTTPADKKEL